MAGCCFAQCQAPVQAFLRPGMWVPCLRRLHLFEQEWRIAASVDEVRARPLINWLSIWTSGSAAYLNLSIYTISASVFSSSLFFLFPPSFLFTLPPFPLPTSFSLPHSLPLAFSFNSHLHALSTLVYASPSVSSRVTERRSASPNTQSEERYALYPDLCLHSWL